MDYVRCKTCVMPNTRPDTPFVDGECSACISYRNRKVIDWASRKRDLMALLDRHNGKCIVPSSGGKDSTAQVLMLQELGADVTVVTATTCHLTKTGRANIDNLAYYARTYEVSPNKRVRTKLNKQGLKLVGDISWPEHVAIFTTPFRMAKSLGIDLIFYGENSQAEYGGPAGSDQAMQLTTRWRSEFGGFLGLRPIDLVGEDGLSACDMSDYDLPADVTGIEAHFLGQYLEWDSAANAHLAHAAGMQFALPTVANWWAHENQDNAQTGIHDHMMYRKFGYGRGCAQISVDVRSGKMPRENAMQWIAQHDGLFPDTYLRIHNIEILDRIGMKPEELTEIMDSFTNWELFDKSASRVSLVLKEFA